MIEATTESIAAVQRANPLCAGLTLQGKIRVVSFCFGHRRIAQGTYTKMQEVDNSPSLQTTLLLLESAAKGRDVHASACLLAQLSDELMKVEPTSPDLALIEHVARDVLTVLKTEPEGRKEALIELGEVLSYLPLERSAELVSASNDMLGMEYVRDGNYTAALVCLNKSISLEAVSLRPLPNRSAPYLHLAQLHTRLGNLRQALRYASQSVSYTEEENEKKSQPGTRARLEELYLLLSDCEEALGRPDRARFWRERRFKILGTHSRHKSLQTSDLPENSNHLSSTSSQGCFDHWPPKLQQTQSEFHVGAFGEFSTVESCGTNRTSGGNSTKRRVSIEGEALSSSRSSVVFPLRPIIRRSSEQLPMKDANSTHTRHRVSLKLVPRTTAEEDHETTVKVIHEEDKTLSNRLPAHVTLSETEFSQWILRVKVTASEAFSIEKRLDKSHPWRSFAPSLLVSLVDLDESKHMMLNYPAEDSSRSEVSTPFIWIDLFSEKKAYSRGTCEVRYQTGQDLKEVLITANTPGKVLRKTVVNDISLTTQDELKRYVTTVLSPQVNIIGEKIALRNPRPIRADSKELLFQAKQLVPPSFHCLLSVYLVTTPGRAHWLITAKHEHREAVLELSNTEAETVTETSNLKICAERLAGLAVLASDTVLTLSCKQLTQGMSITITPANDDHAPKEYRRSYPSAEGKPHTEAELRTAAVKIQSFARMLSAMKRVETLKSRSSVCIHRSVARLYSRFFVVSLTRSCASGSIHAVAYDFTSKISMIVQCGANTVPECADLHEFTVGLFPADPPHYYKKHLLGTRRQQSRGSNYQVSMSSLEEHAEIHALKLHKSL